MSKPRQTRFPAPPLEVGDRVEIMARGAKAAIDILGAGYIEEISEGKYKVNGTYYDKQQIMFVPLPWELEARIKPYRDRYQQLGGLVKDRDRRNWEAQA